MPSQPKKGLTLLLWTKKTNTWSIQIIILFLHQFLWLCFCCCFLQHINKQDKFSCLYVFRCCSLQLHFLDFLWWGICWWIQSRPQFHSFITQALRELSLGRHFKSFSIHSRGWSDLSLSQKTCCYVQCFSMKNIVLCQILLKLNVHSVSFISVLVMTKAQLFQVCMGQWLLVSVISAGIPPELLAGVPVASEEPSATSTGTRRAAADSLPFHQNISKKVLAIKLLLFESLGGTPRIWVVIPDSP